MSQGNLDFDKRKRCVQQMVTPSGLKYERIYYGLNREDLLKIFPNNYAPQDVTEDYGRLSRGARRARSDWYEREKPRAYYHGVLR